MAILFKTDGTQHLVKPSNGRDFSLEELRTLIGCEWIEVAHLNGPDGAFFVLDDMGKLTGKPFNAKATAVFRHFRMDYIVGDALLCKHGEVR